MEFMNKEKDNKTYTENFKGDIPLINQVIFTNSHNKSILISNHESHFKQELSVSSIITDDNEYIENVKENEKKNILDKVAILELSRDEDIKEADFIENDGYSIVSLDQNEGNHLKKQSFFKKFFCFG
ncbi:hypothetical protein RB653_007075 [Dictyostelium firmibasis]|uniref:Uncharacterized protein n=1 Tax=Dictyostelium firmibasis TaxID=79012 RepID=A0AAN7U0L7_9MYCE